MARAARYTRAREDRPPPASPVNTWLITKAPRLSQLPNQIVPPVAADTIGIPSTITSEVQPTAVAAPAPQRAPCQEKTRPPGGSVAAGRSDHHTPVEVAATNLRSSATPIPYTLPNMGPSITTDHEPGPVGAASYITGNEAYRPGSFSVRVRQPANT